MAEVDYSKPLANSRHEKFAQGLASGKSQTQAYIDAGYSAKGAKESASQLLTKPNVASRRDYLNGKNAANAVLSCEQVLNETLDTIRKAKMDGSHSAAVSGLNLYSKICGYDAPSKSDVTINFEKVEELTNEQLAAIATQGIES